MKLLGLVPTLYARDLRASVAFYVDVLGFSTDGEIGDEWAQVRLDDVRIAFVPPNAQLSFEKPTFTGSLYLRVDDVDALWARLEGRAKICYPPEDFPYGMRECAIWDRDGYLLQFGQDIA